jgi:hypothetical protein
MRFIFLIKAEACFKMKKYLFFFCCLLTIGTSETLAQADAFKNVQVKARFQQSPVYQAANYSASNQSNCEWLVLNISYTAGGGTKSNEPVWLDDVSIEAEILFLADYQGKKVMALVTGKTIYWSIEMDGRKHQDIMAVPPGIFKRYTLNPTFKTIPVVGRVIFYSKSRSILGGGYFDVNQKGSIADREIAGMFEKYNGPVSNSLKIENMIFPRDKSPWSAIQYDFYDLLKPEIKK